jgi:hypothetical protein
LKFSTPVTERPLEPALPETGTDQAGAGFMQFSLPANSVQVDGSAKIIAK